MTIGKAKTLAEDALRPALPDIFARYKSGLDDELRGAMLHFADGQDGVDSTGRLYRMLQYHMGWADQDGNLLTAPVSQGKALRPTLCLFACEAMMEDWTPALPAAAALEYIHNFSLIHDDIQDGDLERRHRPTVWALWGQPQALVAGNAMRSLADNTALRLTERGVTWEKALRASTLLTQGYLDMTRGQCMDLAFETRRDIRLQEYLTMISCKTGALIRCGTEMGTLIGSDGEESVKAFAACGAFLGLAFQIRDDVLGIWGDEAAIGKAVGNDIRRKKKSFPIVYALEAAGEVARRKLIDTYDKDSLDDEDVEDVLAVLDELDVAARAQEIICEQADLAVRQARKVSLPAWARRELEGLIDFLATRQY